MGLMFKIKNYAMGQRDKLAQSEGFSSFAEKQELIKKARQEGRKKGLEALKKNIIKKEKQKASKRISEPKTFLEKLDSGLTQFDQAVQLFDKKFNIGPAPGLDKSLSGGIPPALADPFGSIGKSKGRPSVLDDPLGKRF